MACSILNCKNRPLKGDPVKFFSFPKDEVVANEWLKHCKPTAKIKTGRVCSAHFLASDYCEPSPMYKLCPEFTLPKNFRPIKPDAVPSLFPDKFEQSRKVILVEKSVDTVPVPIQKNIIEIELLPRSSSVQPPQNQDTQAPTKQKLWVHHYSTDISNSSNASMTGRREQKGQGTLHNSLPCFSKQASVSQKEVINVDPLNTQCRICLSKGEIPIFTEDKKSNTLNFIRIFGGIMISENDNLPKHICITCHQLLMGAVVFRRNAKRSDYFLRGGDLSETNELMFSDNFSINDVNSISVKASDVSNKKSELNYMTIKGNKKKQMFVYNSQSETEETNNSEEWPNQSCKLCGLQFKLFEDYHEHMSSYNHIKSDTLEDFEDKSNSESLKYSENTREDAFEDHSDSDENKNAFKSENSMEKFKEQSDASNLFTESDNYQEKSKENYFKSILKTNVKLHEIKTEKDVVLRQCSICRVFISYSNYNAHMKIHKDKVQLIKRKREFKTKHKLPHERVCEVCGKTLKTTQSFRLHMLSHGTEFNFKCKVCPYHSNNAPSLKKHILMTHTEKKHKCSQCPAKFATNPKLVLHVKRKHTHEKDFQCGSCEMTFYTRQHVEEHHEIVHSGVKKHLCRICGKGFATRNRQMSHELAVHNRKKMTKSYYLQHKTKELGSKINNDDDNVKHKTACDYICHICGKVFNRNTSLYSHAKKHSGEWNFKCKFCPYRTFNTSALKAHLQTHSSERNYLCAECPSKFLCEGTLKNHILRVHKKEKKIQCDSCEKSFYTRYSMKEHYELVHSGLKSHLCSICGKGFGCRTYRMNHERQAHKREKILPMGNYLKMIVNKANESENQNTVKPS